MFRKPGQILLSVFTLLTLVSITALAAPSQLIIDEGADQLALAFSVSVDRSDRLQIEFTLPALDLEEVVVGEELFHALSIRGGNIAGEAGAPGLPEITRLIALPDGAAVSVRVVDEDLNELAGYRLFPVQPDEAESFVIDLAAYDRPAITRPAVEVGAPAILRDLRVVPVTFRPVRYDPLSGTLSLSRRMTVEVDFSGSDSRAPLPARRDMIPESFDSLYRDMVLNYEASDFGRSDDVQVGPGTLLYVVCDNSTIQNILEPLLDWRRRQGYNVISVDTDETGTSTGAIKSYIQTTYNTVSPPLEHVILVGDADGTYDVACWHESLSGYYGEGDHYYTNLAGGDVLSDVHIGRLSIRTTTEMQTVVDKILTYETDPPLADSGWFTRATLCGDRSSSGITCIYVNQWLKEQLLASGYTQVDTIWSGSFTSQMVSSANQGVSVFGYRGYLNMSGMQTSHILTLTNGDKLPLAVVVTCGTGSFHDDQTCRSEAFLRAPNGGGIGAVGTATWGTHTRYNNCYYHGVWEGAINGADNRMGVAHTRGKIELYNNYQLSQPNTVEVWSMWNNLMGSPVVDMRTAYPQTLTVTHPGMLAVGAHTVPVTVMTGGLPKGGILVCAYKEGEIQSSGYTDAGGEILLPLGAHSTGELLVTVSGHNVLPYLGSLTLGNASVFLSSSDLLIDDDLTGDSVGNGNGIVNPGELIELSVKLNNLGLNTATSVTAALRGADHVSMIDGEEDYGDIPAGGSAWCEEDFDLRVSNLARDGERLELELTAESGLASWISLVTLTVQSADLNYAGYSWNGSPGASIYAGTSGELALNLDNVGSLGATGVSAVLSSSSPWVQIDKASASFGNIASGSDGDNDADPFEISVDVNCFDGHEAGFTLTTIYNDGAVGILDFTLTVGTTGSNDPTGPDGYGYYAFDITDTSSGYAPAYQWVEIAPNHGGSGISVGLSDFGWEQDDTEVLDLPFSFRYYGQDFDQISICSNGWAAMGVSSLRHYRNWSIPSAGSPNGMIAPFWDNLYQYSQDKVYYYHDSANHRFIVQWSRVKNHSASIANFELILLDPAYYPTATGDGEIIFQYNQFSNSDTTNGYATVGIQNLDGSDGLLYTYWSQYTPGSSILGNSRALRIMTVNNMLEPSCVVSPDEMNVVLMPASTWSKWLQISNNGEAGSSLHYRIEVIGGGGGINPDDAWVAVGQSEGDIPQGDTVDIEVVFNSMDLELGRYFAQLIVVHDGGDPVALPVTLVVTDGTGAEGVPVATFMAQNHPNPFNPTTRIDFGLNEAGRARLCVFDVEGRLVKVLVDTELPAGHHQVSWNGKDASGRLLASGVYFYRLEAGLISMRSKMLLLK